MDAVFDAAIALFIRAFALAVGLVLLVAAFHKLRGWAEFRVAVANYRLLPDALVVPVAVALPALEAMAGVGLLVDGLRVAGAALAITAVGSATAAVAINVSRGRTDVDCGCGGIEGHQRLSWGLVARNALLLAGLVASTLAGPAQPLTPVAYTTLAAAALALVALYAAASELLANRSLLVDLTSRS
jgi:hypothetical protein